MAGEDNDQATARAPAQPMRAMVLSAGLGTRLQPLTRKMPKPLVRVAGRTLIDRILDRLEDAGIEEVVVNTHHKAEMLQDHLAERASPRITISHEPELLETGGGVLQALPLLGDGAFLAINSDIIWHDAVEDSLRLLQRRFDPERMDALLLLQPTVTAVGYEGRGDFTMSPGGQLARRRPARIAPFLFAGIQILQPHLFDGMVVEPFSLNRVYDRAAENGRLYGLRHDGEWLEVGTPARLRFAEQLLRGRR